MKWDGTHEAKHRVSRPRSLHVGAGAGRSSSTRASISERTTASSSRPGPSCPATVHTTRSSPRTSTAGRRPSSPSTPSRSASWRAAPASRCRTASGSSAATARSRASRPSPATPPSRGDRRSRQGRLLPCATSPDGALCPLDVSRPRPAFARLVLFDVAKGVETIVASRWATRSSASPRAGPPTPATSSTRRTARSTTTASTSSRARGSSTRSTGASATAGSSARAGPPTARSSTSRTRPSSAYCPPSSSPRPSTAAWPAWACSRARRPSPSTPTSTTSGCPATARGSSSPRAAGTSSSSTSIPDDFGSDPRVTALPYLFLQGDTMVRDVLWPAGRRGHGLHRLLAQRKRAPRAPTASPPRPILPSSASPPPSRAWTLSGAIELVALPRRVEGRGRHRLPASTVRSYVDWARSGTDQVAGRPPRALALRGQLWSSPAPRSSRRSSLYGAARPRRPLAGREVRPLRRRRPSTPRQAAPPTRRPAMAGDAIARAAVLGRRDRGLDPARRPSLPCRPPSSSTAYRVYLDALAAGSYRNTLMVRSVKALGTKPLFPPPATSYAAFPDAGGAALGPCLRPRLAHQASRARPSSSTPSARPKASSACSMRSRTTASRPPSSSTASS